ncbi:unknown [Crocosphaera subtropica ATCC 51142]|uniref:Uncharacterized protein n=1 Tax=Crocosphaera subtropica (strain ATCC 51142 / BH68) TaxID=43989 RepID=B1WRI0_CROS5|nr:hypothetical protein [Crocosphaera subtropica]ACB51829.1 unknown [Crocosphaera subtropica ATCC 51142]
MTISKTEAKQLLERMIFEQTNPQDWVEDVWGLSAVHGEISAKLLEAFYALIETCPEEKLDNFVQSLLSEKLK